MNSPTPVPPDVAQLILSLIENDLILDVAPPLGILATNIAAANGDPIKETAAWVQFQGNLIQAAPVALGGIESQLATIVATKIAAIEAKAAAAAAAAQAALGGTSSAKPA